MPSFCLHSNNVHTGSFYVNNILTLIFEKLPGKLSTAENINNI